jgi:hypothetical protein
MPKAIVRQQLIDIEDALNNATDEQLNQAFDDLDFVLQYNADTAFATFLIDKCMKSIHLERNRRISYKDDFERAIKISKEP